MKLHEWLKQDVGDEVFSEFINDNYEILEPNLDEEITRHWYVKDEPDSHMVQAGNVLVVSTATATMCYHSHELANSEFMCDWIRSIILEF